MRTPGFFPVGTFGAVRGLSTSDLREANVEGILSNTYHLFLRPGPEVIANAGGLHGFMSWEGPILTDSGGFQLHSLDHLASTSEDGVTFKSPIDGSSHFLSPEVCIEVQEQLGADLIVVLDHFEPVREGAVEDPSRTRALMERTLRWAARCKRQHRRTDQMLFGIVQGGGLPALRRESAERTVELGFRGHAIGGLGLGESRERRSELLEACLEPLPSETPRYMMGIGNPEDIVDAVLRGVDVFDCVVPTRNGRHGSVFTPEGRVNLRNARFKTAREPIDPACACPTCAHYSAGYLHHLLKVGEALGARLCSLHNVAFYMHLMADLRDAISQGRIAAFATAWRARYLALG